MKRQLILNVAALTPKLLKSGSMPRLAALAEKLGMQSITPDLPAVTASMQAKFLTGQPASVHGAVGNGWYFRDLAEVWFWRQSANLLQAPTFLERWKEKNPASKTAQIFWWWNLPSRADISVTPRPTYWANGNKGPDIHTHPTALRRRLTRRLGKFPLFQFWGPGANIKSTRWIVDATLDVLEEDHPGLTLAYLPHLDYDLQRFGPDSPQAMRAAKELDAEVGRLLDHPITKDLGITVLSEYGITEVSAAVHPNLALREAGWLSVHPAENGVLLDPGNSRAFAVCDHQCAHIYVQHESDIPQVVQLLQKLDGIEKVYTQTDYADLGLDHPRSGEIFVVSKKDRWFAYPYWGPQDTPPDFARTVDIHKKPGYDPCELFLDPEKWAVRFRVAAKILAKKLGFRTLLDVIPLNTSLVRGSHGRLPDHPDEGPVHIGPPLP